MIIGADQMMKFAEGARQLLEAQVVDAAQDKYSKTLFLARLERSSVVDDVVMEAAQAAALEQALSVVVLRFGKTGKAKGPRSFSVSLADANGGLETMHECVLATDADGRYILVPHGRVSTTFHFAIGPKGVERRHGRPQNIAARAIKASRALIAAAQLVTRDVAGIAVHSADSAA